VELQGCVTLGLLQQGGSGARCNCGCCLVGLRILGGVARFWVEPSGGISQKVCGRHLSEGLRKALAFQ